MYRNFFKRLLDIILSGVALIVLSPIFLLLAVLVCARLGTPVLFTQKRPGKDGKIFTMHKFRTMTNEKDEEGRLLPDEVRLTKFGKLLRATSLDELPEIWDIFRGKMSIIGPRPQLVKDMVFFDEEVMKRQSVRPGLTGLAQVNGRNNISWDERFRWDLAYISKITFANDVKIFFKTILKILKRSDISTDGMATSEDYGDYLLRTERISADEYEQKIQSISAIGKNGEMEHDKTKTIWLINHYALPPSLGGLNRGYYFTKNLIARGYKMRIITSSKIHNKDINFIDDNALFCEKEIDGVTFTYVRNKDYQGNGLSRIKNMLEFPKNFKKVCKLLAKTETPDIIYTSSPDPFTAFFAGRVARRMKVPVVTEIRDLWPLSIVEYKNMSNKNPLIQCLYLLEKQIYKKSDAVVFTMEGGYDYIEDKGWGRKIAKNKVFHVNNGIDLEIFRQNCQSCITEDTDLTNPDTFKIIYCGSIRQANNLKLLVDAAAQLQESHPNIRFIVYGDGDKKASLVAFCENNGINNISFKGFVHKNYVPYILSCADYNFFNLQQASVMKYGCSPNKLFDYMASGKPIISNLVVSYDLIKKYNCGFVTKSQSSEDMAAAIISAYELSKDEYTALCVNASRAAEDYDFSILTDKMEEIFHITLENKKGA